jgi:hypothetical protein
MFKKRILQNWKMDLYTYGFYVYCNTLQGQQLGGEYFFVCRDIKVIKECILSTIVYFFGQVRKLQAFNTKHLIFLLP